MSHHDASRFITRALDDVRVRDKLKADPASAFGGYDLTEEEKDAIASANESKLKHIGVDPMTARSWSAFHDVEEFASDMPDAPGDLPADSASKQ